MAEFHTPHAHAAHTNPCGCSTSALDAKWICKHCGAAYTNDLVTFLRFRCYDCGQWGPYRHRVAASEQLLAARSESEPQTPSDREDD